MLEANILIEIKVFKMNTCTVFLSMWLVWSGREQKQSYTSATWWRCLRRNVGQRPWIWQLCWMAASSSRTHTPDSNLDSLINLMVFLFVCFSGFFFFRDRGGNQARKEHAETSAGIKPRLALWDGCANRCTIQSYSANYKKNLQLIIFNKMGMMASSVCQLGSWVGVRHRGPPALHFKYSMSLL